jgi:hypothetical protein
MIYCPNCGTANRDGSRFCNECAAKLPSSTSMRCPQCGAPNLPNSVFCEKCGTRLRTVPVAEEPAEPEPIAPLKKGLSLPTKRSAAELAQPEAAAADQLSQLRAAAPEAATPSTDAASTPASVPEWLRDTSSEEQPDWLTRLVDSSASSAESQPPSPSSAEDTLVTQPAQSSEDQSGGEVPEWLSNLGIVPPAAQSAANDLPDWLQSISPTPPEAEPSAAGDEEIPEWLRTLGTTGELPSLPAAPAANEPAGEPSDLRATMPAAEPPTSIGEEVPDWLRALGETGELKVPTEAPAPIESTDWLSDLRATASAVESQPPAEEVPAWMSALGPSGELPPPAEAETEPQPETPAIDESADWMSSLRAAAPTAEAPSAGEEVPEWLSTLGVIGEPPAEAPAEIPAAEEPADWMSGLRAAAPAAESQPPAEEEVPEWLSTLGVAGEPSAQVEAQVEAPAEMPAAEEPADWMSGLRAATPAIESQPSAGEEVPEWLNTLGMAGEPPAQIEAQAEAPAEPSVETPATDESADWLSSLRAAAPVLQTGALTEGTPAEAEVPDWLRGTETTAQMPTEPSAEIEAAPSLPAAEEAPDWLRDLGSLAQPQPSSAEAEVPDWLRSEAPSAAPGEAAIEPGEVPDWLRAPEPAAEGEAAVPAQPQVSPAELEAPVAPMAVSPEAAQPIPPEELPEWLRGVSAAPRAADRAREMEAAPAAELPGWLASLREGKGAAPAVAGLTQAEIPSWLEALRPKEGEAEPIAEVPAEEIEQEGILAGIAQVLPVTPIMGEVQGQPARLRVETSADDLARAGVFRELLTRPVSTPTVVVTAPTRGAKVRRLIAQWVIAILLLGAISLPFIFSFSFLPQIKDLPASDSLQSAVTQIGLLPEKANVLVVFDYDATQAGEMNQIAKVIFGHLLTRGAHIKAASLNPLGPGLAQSIWDGIDAKIQASGAFSNTGFRPGQSIGVQNLLIESGPIALVIDLAGSPDSVRWWAEQIAVSRLNVPLVAGVSAAAEPLALPYVQSGQVKGLVTGAAGAMVYARQANVLPALDKDPTQPQIRLESQTLAQWLLAAIIIIGLITAFISRMGRRSS